MEDTFWTTAVWCGSMECDLGQGHLALLKAGPRLEFGGFEKELCHCEGRVVVPIGSL